MYVWCISMPNVDRHRTKRVADGYISLYCYVCVYSRKKTALMNFATIRVVDDVLYDVDLLTDRCLPHTLTSLPWRCPVSDPLRNDAADLKSTTGTAIRAPSFTCAAKLPHLNEKTGKTKTGPHGPPTMHLVER